MGYPEEKVRDSFEALVEHTPNDPSIGLYKSESQAQGRSEVNLGWSPADIGFPDVN